jgi:polyisoprenoid-binding protein YceI
MQIRHRPAVAPDPSKEDAMKIFTLTVLSILLLAGAIAAADQYMADKSHSSITFAVKHLVISTVKGKFNDFDATVMADEQDPAKSLVSVAIKAASIDTTEPKRDTHLRSADFFDVEKFPELTFKSTKVEKKGDGYVLTGLLTMHGVTKEIVIPFSASDKIKDPYGMTRFAIEGKTKLNRKDFGVSYNATLDNGGLVVGNEVTVELNMEFVKK